MFFDLYVLSVTRPFLVVRGAFYPLVIRYICVLSQYERTSTEHRRSSERKKRRNNAYVTEVNGHNPITIFGHRYSSVTHSVIL